MLEDEEFRAFLKALGARIRTIRKAKNFDMRHIMITSGYYDAQWRKYETGGSLNLQSLLKITLTLDVPLSELLDGLGQWPRLSVKEIETKSGGSADDPKLQATKPSPSDMKHPKPASGLSAVQREKKKRRDTKSPAAKASSAIASD